MSRPENERSPTVLAHEVERSRRMADVFESYVADSLMQGVLVIEVRILSLYRCSARN